MVDQDDETSELLHVQDKVPRRWRWKWPVTIFLSCFTAMLVGFAIGFAITRQVSTHSRPMDNSMEHFHKMVRDEILPDHIMENMRSYVKTSHLAGGPNSEAYANQIKAHWESFGLQGHVELKSYNVMLSYPTKSGSVAVQIKSDEKEVFITHKNESVLTSDEDIADPVFPYNAYSASGIAKGELIYGNYGEIKDFLFLESKGINCSGKIVLLKYGKAFRASKIVLAQLFGASGVILYSDPSDYTHGDVTYPDSWWLPPDGLQRGTINHLDFDPQSPGYPAIEGIHRLDVNQTDLPKIPVQPISYEDAGHLFRYLDGEVAPSDWQGGLNVTYRLNMLPSNDKQYVLSVHVQNAPNRTIYDVVATIKGSVEPDRIVMLGNHHDAWVLGATDPTSGGAVMSEIIRAMGLALKRGWTPRRTLMFASWDAEEFGLIGSTEWVEEHAAIVADSMVAYLNVDNAVNGNFTISAQVSSQLSNVVFAAANSIKDPFDADSCSLYETWKRKLPNPAEPSVPRTRIPGSGSDFQPFLSRHGIPVTDMRYTYDTDVVGRIPSYPVYHSLHDSYHYFSTFIDPGFERSAVVGQLWSEVAMRLADAVLLPFNLSDGAKQLRLCEHSIYKKYGHTFDDALTKEWAFVGKALDDFTKTALEFHRKTASADLLDVLTVRMLNDQMMNVERAFISPQGRKGMPFNRHLIYGPSEFNNYEGNCFPELSDDLLQRYYSHQSTVLSRPSDDDIIDDMSRIYYHILQATLVMKAGL